MASGKLKVTLGICMVRYGCDLLPQLKNKMTNGADFEHAGSNGIIFGLTINHAWYLWLLNTGARL